LPLDANGPWQIGDLVNVPADSHLAVQARVEEYAVGCQDVATLVPGVTTDVTVAVFDLPLALEQTDLESTFTFVPDAAGAEGWSAMLDGAIAAAEGTFISPNAPSEGAALLDAMRAAVPVASQPAFDQARTQGSWDSHADAWLVQHAPSMRSRVSAWLGAGKAGALGLLAAHVSPGLGAGSATMTLETFAGFDAAAAGFSLMRSGQFAWTADADDTVHLLGTVHLAPTALAARAADAQASTAAAGATDVAHALSSLMDCAGLASSLVGSGASYPSCDAACTGALCTTALTALWTAARDASAAAGDDVGIQITASAGAMVAADTAQTNAVTPAPARFAGTWVGEVAHAGAATFPMQGATQGQNAVLVK
jgi:hypothetical protein